MNRFRAKRKAKEEGATSKTGHDEPSGPFRRFGKSKKHEEDQKKTIDLTTALPSKDDFRTSLLMTGLSARFSMLREQDDPNTKIGKASDDSVLFPKRQSRLMDYGFRGLGDIAEVESIKAPPFSRLDSYSDDPDSTKDSIMNRSKPGEGNNLFGGRQKVYKIPTGGAPSNALGKAMYEDDISQSAFQKWRQQERDQRSFEDELRKNASRTEAYLTRPESPPPMGYNRRRETNSTMSSAPSVGRNSTAATSITSQPTPSMKDWQSASASASPTPAFEKHVPRTRRLYEPGLTQDLHEHQNSALSRIDTLARRFGTRTPDLSQNSSPTGLLFGDRVSDRRLLTKASAPNLYTPPMSGSSLHAPMDLGIKVPDTKPVFGGSPPLSPPVSDTEDHPLLPIQPADRGKATAMGVFHKPLQPYDESRFAQRQIQLQQGRETPTQRFRAESTASQATGRSSSSSSVQRKPVEKFEPLTLNLETDHVKEESLSGTFLDTDSAYHSESKPSMPAPDGPRPSDLDHPAFRDSALPTPLSLTSRVSDEPSPVSDGPEQLGQASPVDSPTLGPASGLSGMVRQHLRNDSNASSIYGMPTHQSILHSKPMGDPVDTQSFEELGLKANPWENHDWSLSYYGNDSQPKVETPSQDSPNREPGTNVSSERTSIIHQTGSTSEMEKERDEFANQLADGARRVRERLTSYVEADSSQPLAGLADVDIKDTPAPRSNPLGILKSKSSRGSLIDRHREAASQSKAMKMLGIGSATISTSPGPSRQAFDDRDPLSPMQEEHEPIATTEGSRSSHERDEDDENMHAGLRQFRQARRELQRLKERETQQRHQGQHPPVSTHSNQASRRTPSRERRPPPVLYRQRAPSEEPRSQPGSRSASRPASRDGRDRSGSEASTGAQSHNRPPRLRNDLAPHDEHHHGLNGSPRQAPMMRSPGLPGTDIRRSPIMPPHGPHPGAAPSPAYYERSPSTQNLTVGPYQRSGESGQPSPISPIGGLPSPFANVNTGATTPTVPLHSPRRPSSPPRRPSAPSTPVLDSNPTRLDESMKRFVKKKDISEPTFVSTTSRVPTVDLPESTTRARSGSRSRPGNLLGFTASTPNLHSHTNAPPLPPINPRRRNVLNGFMGRKGEEDYTASTPHLPYSPMQSDAADDINATKSIFSVSDDEDAGKERRRLRKTSSERNSLNPRVKARGNSPPYTRSGLLGGMI